jgi:hypothetical protein
VAKSREPLEVDGYILSPPKNVAFGLRFKIWIMSRGAGQSLAGGFCEGFLNSRLTQVGQDNVRLGVSILDGLEKDLEFARLNNFHFIQHTPLNGLVFKYSRIIKMI